MEVKHTVLTIEAGIEDSKSLGDWWFVGVYASSDAQIRKKQWKVLNKKKRLWGARFMISGDFIDIVVQ